MMPEPTWTAGLFGAGAGSDDLADAERRVAILKAELEAIRAGRKEASAAELRKLEREYRDAVTKAGQLRLAQAPPTAGGMRLPMIAKGGVTPGVQPRPGVRPTMQPRPGVTPRPTGTPMPPTMGGAGAVPRPAPRPVPTPGGTPVPPVAARAAGGAGGGGISGLWQSLLQKRTDLPPQTAGMAIAGQARQALGMGGDRGQPAGGPISRRGLLGIPSGPGLDYDPTAMTRMPSYLQPQYPSGAGAGGGAAGDYGLIDPFFAMLSDEDKKRYIAMKLGGLGAYEAGSLEQRQAEAAALQAYRMAQLGQGQAAAGATAAWRQQQGQTAADQLKQAWAIAQQELAHAQNVMASQIGTGVAGMQSQMWAQGLPHALPQGTTVAPGFERGGPMSQLYRMSGSQFRPGETGRISPYPQPSQQQLMKWVQQAMGQFGAGG